MPSKESFGSIMGWQRSSKYLDQLVDVCVDTDEWQEEGESSVSM
jgi:hypothetical protein